MKALAVLPISTKNMLEESRVLQFIQRWAQSRPLVQPTEQDGYSSESTSRAQTPLNTPDGPPAKLPTELDGDTPKRAVYRRLKIISENSLDSALSDASKASDGKEEEDEEEEEMEDEASQLETLEKVESVDEVRVEIDPVVEQETPEAADITPSQPEDMSTEDMTTEDESLKAQESEEKPPCETEEQLSTEENKPTHEEEKVMEEIKIEEPSVNSESTPAEDPPAVTDITSAEDVDDKNVETLIADEQVENGPEHCSSEDNTTSEEITPTQPSEGISSEATAVPW